MRNFPPSSLESWGECGPEVDGEENFSPPHTSMEQTNERASELHISSSAYVSEEKNLRLRLAYIFLIFLYTRQRAKLGIQFIH
jgi:hypothetical protein